MLEETNKMTFNTKLKEFRLQLDGLLLFLGNIYEYLNISVPEMVKPFNFSAIHMATDLRIQLHVLLGSSGREHKSNKIR